LTPFEFLLNCAYNDKKFKILAETAFYFFIKEKITFLYEDKKIIIGDLTQVLQDINNVSELRFLTEEDYFDF
jgi:hypothetical protein